MIDIPSKVVSDLELSKGQWILVRILDTRVGVYTVWKKIFKRGPSTLSISFTKNDAEVTDMDIGTDLSIVIFQRLLK